MKPDGERYLFRLRRLCLLSSMPTSWLSWKMSAICKPQPHEVYDPQKLVDTRRKKVVFVSRRLYRSGCSRSLANLKDVINTSRRIERSTNFSPVSVERGDLVNPSTYGDNSRDSNLEELAENCRSYIKSTNLGYGTPLHQSAGNSGNSTPVLTSAKRNTIKKLSGCYDCRNSSVPLFLHKATATACSTATIRQGGCRKCGELFLLNGGIEQHHLLKHAVTELEAGDSSRNVVEIIFRTSWVTVGPTKEEKGFDVKIERVLKVNNLAKTVAKFEEYREGVKLRASNLPKKHARCLADGNELLRFYGTTLECELGPSGVCSSSSCNVCQVIRSGFPSKNSHSVKGIVTTASSGRAHEFVAQNHRSGHQQVTPAMLVCRVIAGRIHKRNSDSGSEPLTLFSPAISSPLPAPGFDSIARTPIGIHSRIEELTVFNPRAILPCFVVIYQ